MNMVKAFEKLKSFIAKLPLWSRRVQSGNLANFPFLNEILVEGGASLLENVQLEIVAHMKTLSTSFNNYFSPGELNVMETWIIDPFKFNVDTLPDDESYKEDLIDLKESRNMKMEFRNMKIFGVYNWKHIQSWLKKLWQFFFLFRLLIFAKLGFLSKFI